MGSNIETRLYKLIEKKQDLKEFEQWVYSTPELEDFLSPENYLDLISLNYSESGAWYEIQKIILRTIDVSDFEAWRLTKALRSIVAKDENQVDSILEMYDFYCRGYNFLQELGLNYGLCLEVPSSVHGKECFSELTQSEVETIVSGFYLSIEREAKKVLAWIENKEIIPNGYDDENYFTYTDNRSKAK